MTKKKIIDFVKNIDYGKMSHLEYKAMLNGLNIFFGAVLGFVLAGTENLSSLEFGVMLSILATAVILILYISSSKHRILYSIFALIIALLAPDMIEGALKIQGAISEKVQPTLVVWALMTIVVEFWPQNKPEAEKVD